MKTVQKILGAVLVTAAVGTSIVAAQTNSNSNTAAGVKSGKDVNFSVNHPRLSLDEHQKLRALVEAGDYAGWKSLMATDGLTAQADQVTAEKFAKMTQLLKLEAQVDALRKEIGPMPGLGMGPMMGGKGGRLGGMMGGERRGTGPDFPAIDALPQTVKDQLKAAFEKHDRAAVDKILKDNGVTPPARPFDDQDSKVNSNSSTTQN